MAKGKYDQYLMTPSDLALADQYGQQWVAAQEKGDEQGKRAANTAANALRGKYGYSGGASGTQYLPAAGQPQKPSWASPYTQQIQQVSGQILDRTPFQYDVEADPLYQQLRTAYTQQGQSAMEDTVGQVAARTGGLASSYAATAGQQAYNGYMNQLSGQIPKLQQLAYSMYMDEGDRGRQDLAMLQGLEDTGYGRHLDALGQFNTDRAFDYGVSRDAVGDARDERDWGYGVARDQVEDARYGQQWQYQLDRDQIDDQRYQQEWNRQGARSGFSGSSSSGGGAGRGGQMDYDGLFQAAMDSGNPKSFLSNRYKDFGFSSSSGLAGDYETWASNQGAQEDGDAAVDMDSVTALGFGPISEDRLVELERQGAIESYVEDGRIKFRRRQDAGAAGQRYGQAPLGGLRGYGSKL